MPTHKRYLAAKNHMVNRVTCLLAVDSHHLLVEKKRAKTALTAYVEDHLVMVCCSHVPTGDQME